MASDKDSKNFQPRDRGQVEDALDRGAAERARERSRAAARGDENPGPLEETRWEAEVERGSEWLDPEVPAREARGDEEPDSEVSRRGLVNPPPER
ncbi:hypothetical protein [Corallococcus sp. RDP092CA]|uniref:hypothetical protein n=1 Tax=Corallococcus sp. RDP092CA TaxID=3109369 RepID=UPI0035B392EF